MVELMFLLLPLGDRRLELPQLLLGVHALSNLVSRHPLAVVDECLLGKCQLDAVAGSTAGYTIGDLVAPRIVYSINSIQPGCAAGVVALLLGKDGLLIKESTIVAGLNAELLERLLREREFQAALLGTALVGTVVSAQSPS